MTICKNSAKITSNKREIMNIIDRYINALSDSDVPSVITDTRLRIIWRNKASDTPATPFRKASSLRYYIFKPEFLALSRLNPGEAMRVNFTFSPGVSGFAKREEDCCIIRINSFSAAVYDRIISLNEKNNEFLEAAFAQISAPDVKKIYSEKSRYRLHFNEMIRIFNTIGDDTVRRIEVGTQLGSFARQATDVLGKPEILYTPERDCVFADLNLHDFYMLLSAIVSCMLKCKQSLRCIKIFKELCGTEVTVSFTCDGTEIAEMFAPLCSDTDRLLTLCEYGDKYLDLMLARLLADHYGWRFGVKKNGEKSCIWFRISLIWNRTTEIVLYQDDYSQPVIYDMLNNFEQ